MSQKIKNIDLTFQELYLLSSDIFPFFGVITKFFQRYGNSRSRFPNRSVQNMRRYRIRKPQRDILTLNSLEALIHWSLCLWFILKCIFNIILKHYLHQRNKILRILQLQVHKGLYKASSSSLLTYKRNPFGTYFLYTDRSNDKIFKFCQKNQKLPLCEERNQKPWDLSILQKKINDK